MELTAEDIKKIRTIIREQDDLIEKHEKALEKLKTEKKTLRENLTY